MDWNAEQVVQWLNEIGLSKYAKRFKGYLVNGAVLVQMDETLLDDLEVTDAKDREILLSETAKLAATQSDKSQVFSTSNDTEHTLQNTPVTETPLITLSDFDDGDNGQKSVLICDDDDDDYLQNYSRRISNEELINQRIINLAYRDGEDSTTDDNSERDFSFKGSEDENDFDIYDEDQDTKVESCAVASRATQMVELLSRDNLALRAKLEDAYIKINNMQMLECELQSMRTAYEELQMSFRKRESLEYSTRTRIEAEMSKLQENNRNLRAHVDASRDEVEQGKQKSLEKFSSDVQLKNEVIRQLIAQNNSLAATREEIENTIKQQRKQIEELEGHKDRLSSSLAQSREQVSYLQHELTQQLHANHVSTARNSHVQHVTGSSSVKEANTHHQHTNSADEGIAELDGPTSVPVLLEMLRERDDKIQVLGENLSRLEQTLLQEGTSRSLAIRAVSVPKEARIAALEKSIQEREKIIAECRVENLKTVEELYVTNRRCADLEAIIKSLHSQLAEKTTRLRLLQNNDGEDEPNEPEWPLDPAFCRTDFAQMKDLARDSYAESLDSGMSLTNALDMRHTDEEFKTIDEPDQLSVHYWSV